MDQHSISPGVGGVEAMTAVCGRARNLAMTHGRGRGALLAELVGMHSAARESVPPPSAPPSFDVAAVASVAGLRDTAGNVPLDACVPTRTPRVPPASLGVRTAFVLLHVDGRASLQDIATLACLSLPDTIEAFLQLLSLGLVGVRDEHALTGEAEARRPAGASAA